MAVVRMVQVAGDQVIRVFAVRDGLVPAAGAVNVAGRVTVADVVRGTLRRVMGADGKGMLVDVVAVHVVKVAVVQKVDVPLVADGSVAATGPVNVGMSLVDVVTHR